MNYKFIILIIGLALFSISCETPLESDVQRDYDDELPDGPVILETLDHIDINMIEYYGSSGQNLFGLDLSEFIEIETEDVTLDTTKGRLILDADEIKIKRLLTGVEANYMVDFTNEVKIKIHKLDISDPGTNFQQRDIEFEIELANGDDEHDTFKDRDIELAYVGFPKISKEAIELHLIARILNPRTFIQEVELSILFVFDSEKYFD